MLIKGGMFINYLIIYSFKHFFFTFFPLAYVLKNQIIYHFKGAMLIPGVLLLFLPNVLGATFIPEATPIPDSRVSMIFRRLAQ